MERTWIFMPHENIRSQFSCMWILIIFSRKPVFSIELLSHESDARYLAHHIGPRMWCKIDEFSNCFGLKLGVQEHLQEYD